MDETRVLTGEESKRWQYIREQIEKTILPFRENTEAAIVVGALLQVARILLDNYPEQTRGELLEGAVAFLQRRDMVAEEAAARAREAGIVVPKGFLN